MNTVSLNGTRVDDFRACTQTRHAVPVAVTLTATVELSTDDLAAALYRWETATQDELDRDDDVRLFIAEAVLNGGLSDLSDQRAELAACVPGTAQWEWAQYCRRRVGQLYGTRPATAARELVNA